MTIRAVRYTPPSLRQRLTYQGKLIGCTETSFAMAARAQALGGLKVTELLCRSLSGEWPPDPSSPGLNQDQLEAVARRLHMPYSDGTGGTWADVAQKLREDRKLVVQLWYADIGGTPIGHALYLDVIRTTRDGVEVGGVDPMVGRRKWYRAADVRRAMETFGRRTGLPAGQVRYGFTREVPLMAVG